MKKERNNNNNLIGWNHRRIKKLKENHATHIDYETLSSITGHGLSKYENLSINIWVNIIKKITTGN